MAANPNCVAPTSVHTIRNWYNPCAFVPAAYGTYGQERRNSEVGPRQLEPQPGGVADVLIARASKAGFPG